VKKSVQSHEKKRLGPEGGRNRESSGRGRLRIVTPCRG
jgi:hypothetical protein